MARLNAETRRGLETWWGELACVAGNLKKHILLVLVRILQWNVYTNTWHDRNINQIVMNYINNLYLSHIPLDLSPAIFVLL